jgi:hypothetical protein
VVSDHSKKLQEESEYDAAMRLVLLLKNRGVDSLRIHVEALKIIKEAVAQMKRERRL